VGHVEALTKRQCKGFSPVLFTVVKNDVKEERGIRYRRVVARGRHEFEEWGQYIVKWGGGKNKYSKKY